MTDKPKRDDEFLKRTYNPAEVEDGWYQYWMDNDLFSPESDAARKTYNGDHFCIVVPPPNITGGLHIGHSLNFTLQDVIIRFKRMQGFETLWLPGYDHAGIATQMIVSRQLEAKGIKREELGREKFLEKVWEWKELNSNQIIEQVREMGCAMDWKRIRFTLDDKLTNAVLEAFVRLYEKGEIYRGTYIVNWCPSCRTAISDLEVDHEEIDGAFWDIAYPMADGSGEMVVSTTRPETMLADTAVAVNPSDERYQGLNLKKVILPLMDIEIPIIADDYVDIGLGTGCLKITPAHDPNDYEIGLRHNLDMPKCIGPDGTMTDLYPPLAGMDRLEARVKVLELLEKRGYLRGKKLYSHQVGHCFRCKTMIEPYVSEQWFLNTDNLVKPAIRIVKDGRLKLITDKWNKVYFDWLENIRPWCISRQLWWGHRIPAYYCPDGHVTVAKEMPPKCSGCDSTELRQDDDVLDTWFSSALWPFSTMGWPEETEDLKKFYPSNVLVTAFDILFFWVARMAIMGMEFMDDTPFHDCILHGLVRDEKGEKMSRTKGNAIDPLEAIKEHGRDVLRFTLNHYFYRGKQDFTLTADRFKGSRFFINKLWNASKFVLMNLGEDFKPSKNLKGVSTSLADNWILHRLNNVIEEYTTRMEEYDFGTASNALYSFIWDDFCDWYLEITKDTLYSEAESPKRNIRQVLYHCLVTILKLLSPVIPYVTEEIYRELPGTGDESMTTQEWPKPYTGLYPPAISTGYRNEDFEFMQELTRAARSLRKEIGLPDNTKVNIFLEPPIAKQKLDEVLESMFKSLAKISTIHTVEAGQRKPEKALFETVQGWNMFLQVENIEALKDEVEQLSKKIIDKKKYIVSIEKKLAQEKFISNAPAHVIEKEREKLSTAQKELLELHNRFEKIKDIVGN